MPPATTFSRDIFEALQVIRFQNVPSFNQKIWRDFLHDKTADKVVNKSNFLKLISYIPVI